MACSLAQRPVGAALGALNPPMVLSISPVSMASTSQAAPPCKKHLANNACTVGGSCAPGPSASAKHGVAPTDGCHGLTRTSIVGLLPYGRFTMDTVRRVGSLQPFVVESVNEARRLLVVADVKKGSSRSLAA
eukprot:353794-Chlamydomonas_euryale.AAC.9